MHLQCNTGADSISLARKGAVVTGVDLVPENIFYARKMAEELGVKNISFIECDIMKLAEMHQEKYDIVFTSEGAIDWLPDLKKWTKTVKQLLHKGGYFYILDSHPFFLMFDETELRNEKLVLKYPYFLKKPDYSDDIGGYASEAKAGENYFWMYTISEVINSLIEAGLKIEYLHESDKLFFDLGGMANSGYGEYHYPFFDTKMPFQFSLKAAHSD
nr:methyltransferase domain-containing protein [Brucepastera parasyntrophica]